MADDEEALLRILFQVIRDRPQRLIGLGLHDVLVGVEIDSGQDDLALLAECPS